MRKYILFMFLCLHYVARGQTDTQKFTYAVGDEIRTDTCVYIVRGSNLITNPSFDDGTTGWMAGDGNSLSETYFEVVTSGGADGGAYLKCLGGAGTNTNQSVKTSFAISPGKTYLFSCWAYRTNSSDNRQWSRLFLANANQGIDIEVEHINFQQDTWSHTEAIIEAGEYTFLTVNLSWLDNASSFDCFTLMEVEVSDEVVTTRLQEAIASAEQRLAETEEGTENGQYLPETRQALQEAINAAKAIVAHPASQQQVSQAVQTLNAAVVTYNRHVNPIFVSGYEYRYWFDGDISTMVRDVSLDSQWHFDADLGGLEPSLHTIHIQVKDEDGNLSSPQTRFFIQPINTSSNDSKTICWFDNDYSTKTVHDNNGVPFLLDVSSLYDGLHIMHLQVEGGERGYSSPRTASFIKYPQVIGVDYLTCLCMIDGQLYKQERVSAQGGVINWTFDVASLSQGLHRLFVQVLTPSGASTSARQGFFFRVPTDLELEEMECVYCIDGSEFYQQAGQVANGLYHFDVDVSDLEDGLHRITYMLSNGKGVSTKAITQFFTKIPLGGNGIAQYYYWLNDNDADKKTVTLNERQKTLSLISLLPVESEPIRSSCFELRVENGNPVMYAKNDLHIRFLDAAGRFADATGQYVDEKVKQAVVPVGILNETQTFNRVEENGVRWYKVMLEEGDTVAFKSSQACTIQLFSPSGEEVYKASGSASVQFDGCHVWEDGTFYLAVHDVTGSQSTMTLQYMHMDKYDVVGQDVTTVGNGGCSTITFKGNGFTDLYAVELIGPERNIIDSQYIGHESDAETSVIFDFTDEPLGDYEAVFHFTEEDKRFSQMITVEEAVDIELASNVSFPSSFLRGQSVTYTIKITNKGNMTAYQVPFYIYIGSQSNDGISNIKIDGLNLPSMYDIIDKDSLSISDLDQIKKISDDSGDDHYFLGTKTVEENGIDSIFVRTGYFTIELNPKTSKIINLIITADENVDVWITVPNEWLPIITSSNQLANIRRKYAQESESWYCCYHERIECVANAAATLASTANFVVESSDPELAGRMIALAADCLFNTASLTVSWMSDRNCGKGNNDSEKNAWDKIHSWMRGISTAGLAGCLPWNKLKALGKAADFVATAAHPVVVTDCITAFSKKKPNCPPSPPKGGKSTPVRSLDPNDIFGYTSPSGSKYIAKDVQKVNYTIEFENDTAFATASAHTVVVKDTLNSSLFDLASYKPTAIKIGDKQVDLDGNQTFVTTVDMRPSIDAVAQVEGRYDANKGIATWTFTSLNPMTMEPTDDVMQGFLPVNNDGISGIGEVMFEIDLKQQFSNGTEIPNKASIVFDTNEPIMTPTWTNTIDAVKPNSHVSACEIKNDTTATLQFESSDNLSGVWKYDVYVQYEEDASWLKVAEGVTRNECDVRIYEGINHGFYVVATDSAGNVETKDEAREYTLDLFESTEDSNLELELAEGWNWISHNLNNSLNVAEVQTYATRILGQEEESFKDPSFGFVGELKELLPTCGYKIQMSQANDVALDGKLFNASYKSISLVEGWNWIGYPLANAMEITQALEHFTPSDGDYIIGQDGFTQYADGEWIGTLTTLTPGLGYMYKSGEAKQMFFNTTATLSSRVEVNRRGKAMTGNPWTCDKHKYPNVMALTARLYNDGVAENADDYYVAAFCDNECRGVGKSVNGLIMMNVFGLDGETIQFKVIEKETELLIDIDENINFVADVQGSISSPIRLTLGDDITTDIAKLSDSQMKITPAVIKNTMTVDIGAERIDRLTVTNMNGKEVAIWKRLTNGSSVDVSNLAVGVYVVTAKVGKQMMAKKVMKVAE